MAEEVQPAKEGGGGGCVYCQKLSVLYLFFYNWALFAIHAVLFVSILVALVDGSYNWYQFNGLFKLGTLLQLLDLLHARLGLTKTSTTACLVQVFGRLAVLYLIEGNWHIHEAYSTVLLLLTYALVEWFRYPYYALKAIEYEHPRLTWARYSAWILLYPLGLFLEAVTLIRSVNFYFKSGVYSLELPNPLNFSYNMGINIVLLLIFFPFIARFLLSHMAAQRKKKLGDSKEIKVD